MIEIAADLERLNTLASMVNRAPSPSRLYPDAWFVTRDYIPWTDTSGNVMIWFMNGLNVFVVSLGNVGTAWSVQGSNAD